MTTTGNPSTANAARMVTLLSKKLQKVQEDTLVMDQFAMQEDLPMHASARTIRFFKPERASVNLKSAPTDNTIAAINNLTEGVAPTTYRENAFIATDVTLKQYGQVTKISDIHEAIDAFKPLMQNIELMGRDAALHTDTLIRNALVGGTHPGSGTPLTHDSTTQGGTDARFYGSELFATAAAGVFTLTASGGSTSTALFNALKAATQANSKLTRVGILAAVTRLKLKNAPRLKGGRYVCAICPQHSHDLFQDTSYANAFQGRGADGIYKGELGSVDNVTFVEQTNPFTEDETYGTYSTTDTATAGLVYSSLVLGAGAYGVPKLAGSKSPLRPRIIVVDKADSGNPLQQFVLAGWKAYYMAVGLDPENVVNIRSKSTFQ